MSARLNAQVSACHFATKPNEAYRAKLASTEMEAPDELARRARTWNEFRRLVRGHELTMAELGEIWRARDQPPPTFECPPFTYSEPLPRHVRDLLVGIKEEVCATIPEFIVPRHRRAFLGLLLDSRDALEFDSPDDEREIIFRGGVLNDVLIAPGPIPYARLLSATVVLSYAFGGGHPGFSGIPRFSSWESPFGERERMDAWAGALEQRLRRRFGRRYGRIVVNFDSYHNIQNVLITVGHTESP